MVRLWKWAAPTIAASLIAACGQEQAAAPEETGPNFRASAIRADMAFLADDLLEGREAGTRGYDIAANYVAARFELMGITPAGTDGYFQEVPFRRYKTTGEGELLIVDADGDALSFEPKVDFIVSSSSAAENGVSAGPDGAPAPLVFVGYGVHAPDRGVDDYEGVDLGGKIAVSLLGAPPSMNTEERAHFSSNTLKRKAAMEKGAIGMMAIYTPERSERFGFERVAARDGLSWSMNWLTPEGEPFDAAPADYAGALLSMQAAEKLFADEEKSWDAIVAEIEEGGTVEGFALTKSARIEQSSIHEETTSRNVVAVIEGSDPELKDEYVVLTAHLDHIGIGAADDTGDTINNGALDNAAGTAILLEVAHAFSHEGAPKRSLVFLAVTAEEKGLLGAEYFANYPTVPKDAIVANVNLDMPVLTYDFSDVTAFGAERSTLGPIVEEAAAKYDIALAPDPFPGQGIFTRSDHYRFVQQGVPAVFLTTGFGNGGEKAWEVHFGENYHRPSDDMENDLDFDAAAKFAAVNYEIALAIANAEERPLWYEDDFFGELYDGPMADFGPPEPSAGEAR